MQKPNVSLKMLFFLNMSLLCWGFSTTAIAQARLPYDFGIIVESPVSEADVEEDVAELLEANQLGVLEKYRNVKFIPLPPPVELESHGEPYQGEGVVVERVGAINNANIQGSPHLKAEVKYSKGVVVVYKPNEKIQYTITENPDLCQEFANPDEKIKEYQEKYCPSKEEPAVYPGEETLIVDVPVVDDPTEGTALTTENSAPVLTGGSSPEIVTEKITYESDVTEPDVIISQGGGCSLSIISSSSGFSLFWILTPLAFLSLRSIRK